MKINLKIILPITLLLFIILLSFGYLLVYLNQQEKKLSDDAYRFQQLNTLSQRLGREQEVTEFNVLRYSFNASKEALIAISQSELNKAQTIDEIYPYIDTERGRQLIDKYINARINIDAVRNELITAMDTKNLNQIKIKYDVWSVQTQNVRDVIAEIDNYNVTTLGAVLASVDVIGTRIIQVIIILIIVVFIAFFLLFYYLKYIITNPIIRLSAIASEISDKNFSSILDSNLERQDEIGTLFRTFTTMSKNIKELYRSLEQNVKDRTAELTNRTTELEAAQKATLNILEDLNIERKALIETKALDEAILTSIGGGLVVMDKEGVVTYVNDSFELVTGWSKKEVIGKKFADVIPSETEKGEKVTVENRLFSKILAGENPENDYGTTIYYVRKDGSRFPVDSLVERVTIDGEVVGIVKTFTDITKAKEIDRAKTEFVSFAAHQLRTPLSAISWYTEMLLSGDAGELQEMQKKYLDQIYKGNQRMIGMVKSFLNVSRIDLGNLQIEKEMTDVGQLLESVIDEQKQKIAQREINLIYDASKELPNVNLDPKRIRMVFQNLLSNAIKYTHEKGEVKIDIKVYKEDHEIVFEFKDTGYGIPAHEQEKIFTKLFRAENVVERATEGTGLGLYIVKNIIDNSGGRIWFDSVENEGTTFYVSLPL